MSAGSPSLFLGCRWTELASGWWWEHRRPGVALGLHHACLSAPSSRGCSLCRAPGLPFPWCWGPAQRSPWSSAVQNWALPGLVMLRLLLEAGNCSIQPDTGTFGNADEGSLLWALEGPQCCPGSHCGRGPHGLSWVAPSLRDLGTTTGKPDGLSPWWHPHPLQLAGGVGTGSEVRV